MSSAAKAARGRSCAPSLARFQEAFAHALRTGAEAVGETAALVAQPGFAVYRNTVMKGCVDALQDNFPAVLQLVGETWFRAAASCYAQSHPPRDPALVHYGDGFADFLAHFAPAADLPYLSGVACLDRFWIEAHTALDQAAVAPADVARLPPGELAHTVLRPHPSARWAWFAEHPVFTIWRHERETSAGDVRPTPCPWVAEGALIVRPRSAVVWLALDAAGCAFLDACAAGAPLATAAAGALAADARADLTLLMARLLAAGAFGRVETPEALDEECLPCTPLP